MTRLLRTGRTVCLLLAAGYLAGLISYLALRLLFGGRWWWLALLNDFTPLYFLPLPGALVLTLVLRERRLAAIIVVPLAAGIVWFGPRFLPKAQPSPVGPVLRIATFNMWGGNTRLNDVEAWLRQTHADIVMLQEIAPTYADHGIPGLADLYPYQFNKGWDWGDITLSRYPILASDHLDFTEDGSRPVQQRLVIEVAGHKVAVYNIHLQMPTGDRARLPVSQFILKIAAQYDPWVRNGEIARLLVRLKTEPLPFVVAGDFNMSDQSVIYQSLAAAMGDSFREVGWGLGGSWPIPIAQELPAFLPPVIRIDYVWHSAHFQASETYQGPRLGSDHLPLVATLELLPVKP